MTEDAAGDCYEAAARYVLYVDPSATLVHGYPTLTVEPFSVYGHAWVEVSGPAGILLVRDVAGGRDLLVPAGIYYAVGNIDSTACYRYDFTTVQRMLADYCHWGPWEGPEGCPPVDPVDED